MKSYSILPVIVMVFMAIGCSGAGQVSQTSMSAGERALRANCIACHSIPKPVELNDPEWEELLTGHSSMFTISEENYRLIIDYVQENNGK